MKGDREGVEGWRVGEKVNRKIARGDVFELATYSMCCGIYNIFQIGHGQLCGLVCSQ